ncbi:uncharacterized protein CTRU02_215137 [Colletotrichum truncatum]|uniref:Uncharacterized protein n=1 Tax=Colletotrichum truncatum TaxID=5467 RepID=A0ACC3YDJ7_COLTU|nr:uncharacterized protein CTRU02_13677 [Colletotrichum truncatum]KAF6783025.1 hypothetical protein CTRU02_13677 [Colletotrichum truncatum]
MTLLTDMALLVCTQPAPGSPSAFEEDEFVALWFDMYAILVRLNFCRREDIVYPPAATGRHALLDSQQLLNERGMSPEAVSLVERLPYPRVASYKRMRIYPEADAMNYLAEDDVKDCRDPHEMAQYSAQPENLNDASYLLPQDVALARPSESDGLAWILDLNHSVFINLYSPHDAFRFVSGHLEAPARGGSGGLPQDYQVERPDDPDHYRNWPMYHAPTVLRKWIQDVLDLELVPASSEGEYWSTSSDVLGQVISKALRHYGWPTDFREQDWARDSEQIYRAAGEVEERYEKSFNPQFFGRDRKELLSRWRENLNLVPYVGLDL